MFLPRSSSQPVSDEPEFTSGSIQSCRPSAPSTAVKLLPDFISRIPRVVRTNQATSFGNSFPQRGSSDCDEMEVVLKHAAQAKARTRNFVEQFMNTPSAAAQ
jgi:hypothetical protein